MIILQANKFYKYKGGSETAYFGLIGLLERFEHKVVPFSMKDDDNLCTVYDKFFVENINYETKNLFKKLIYAQRIIYSFDAKNKIKLMLREVSPDIAHFHIFQHQISPSVFGPLKQHGIPIVYTLHDLKPICPNYKMLVQGKICEKCVGKKFYNCILNKCTKDSYLKSFINTFEMYFHYAMNYYDMVDKFITVSEFHMNKMVESGFDQKKFVHIPNFIDTEEYVATHHDGGYGLYFGRLSDEKGLPTLISALSNCRNIPFLIVGTGPIESELQNQVIKNGLTNVKFLGFKTGSQLKTLIAEASFTVLPSECYENCPMSVLESFAMGKPVIGARIGGIPELVSDEEDGFLFDSGNDQDLADKIRLIWDDPIKRNDMGRNGLNKVKTQYSPLVHYTNTLEIYNAIIRGN